MKYATDELCKLNDAELQQIFFEIRSEIYQAKRAKQNTRDLEIYYCYVSKEIEDRGNKK